MTKYFFLFFLCLTAAKLYITGICLENRNDQRSDAFYNTDNNENKCNHSCPFIIVVLTVVQTL